MFQRMIDDFKDSVANSARLTSLAAAMALALFIAMSFLCAAAFVYVLQTYGPIQACLTGAAAFLVVTMIVAACYMARRKRIEEARAAAAKSAMHSALADPMLVATGIQLIRAIGVRKLIPILAVAGLALGFLASRSASGAADDDTPET
jgi:hypothetical protein